MRIVVNSSIKHLSWLDFSKDMEITRQFIRICVIIFGILVLSSYVYGLSKAEDKMVLWGGIPHSWIKFIVPWMFIAAIGWLIYWWTILYSVDASVIDQLRWPWQDSADGKGANRLFLAYCVFMIPSMLWLESTLFHINNDYSWTPFLVIGVLTLASIGNILYGLLAYSAYQDGLEGANMMLLGSVMLSIQCIILDGIVWNVKFPW